MRSSRFYLFSSTVVTSTTLLVLRTKEWSAADEEMLCNSLRV